MSKKQNQFVCQECGGTQPRWVGKCPVCGEWDTLIEESISDKEAGILGMINSSSAHVENLKDIDIKELHRKPTGYREFDRVLGGGLVSDEVLLVSGEPGVGKSTLLMQICGTLASDGEDLLYVSGEESSKQIAIRANRILGADNLKGIKLYANGNIEDILNKLKEVSPSVVIIDSIQTLWDEEVKSLPGGVAQVRSCSAKLVHAAKSLGIIVFIVGHINKDGKIAGPKVLEHLVDVVIHLEGHKNSEYRIVRSLKNRFGSTGEVGLLEMDADGLRDMDHSDSFFLSQSVDNENGVARSIIVEGNRSIAVDIQSLVTKSIFAYPKRVSEGLSLNRVQLLAAIMSNSGLVNIESLDLYLRVAGGYSVKDYSYADLSVIASIYSAQVGKSFGSELFFIGEVSLSGYINVPRSFQRYIKEILSIYPGSKVVTSSNLESDIDKSSLVLLNGVSQLKSLLK